MANEQIINTYVSSVTGFNRFVPDATNAPEVMFTSSGSLFIAGLTLTQRVMTITTK